IPNDTLGNHCNSLYIPRHDPLDTTFERPVVASVLRTESDRVPQVLVSQASTDLRRTRSESQLDAKLLDAISMTSSVSGGVEDEISVYTVSSLGSEMPEPVIPPLEGLDAHNLLSPDLITPREKDAKDVTLTPGMTLADVEKEAAAAAAATTTHAVSSIQTATNGTSGVRHACVFSSSECNLRL
ncbi:unnamed protein product, partial [Cylicostephanus goldi]